LGKDADKALVDSLSSEKQITKQTPPTFLFHTDADTGVPPQNSIVFYLALKKAGVPAELHIYQDGRHGLGLAPKTPGTCQWPKACEEWMRVRGLLDRKAS
jgi:acetyl esterase/lipase